MIMAIFKCGIEDDKGEEESSPESQGMNHVFEDAYDDDDDSKYVHTYDHHRLSLTRLILWNKKNGLCL